jgi:hypothetical protein
MKRSLRIALLSLPLAAIGGAFALSRDGKRDARASDPAPASAAPIARLMFAHGEIDSFETAVAIATIDPSTNVARVQTLATMAHSKGSAIRGSAIGDVAFVVASEEAPRGTSYDGALFRVENGRVTRLCGGVARATTPLVTQSGRVFVARGIDGQDPPADEAQKLILRTDALTIDDVDPITGATRTVWKGQGYQAFLGAVTGRDELVVYHSSPSGAAIVILDQAGATRIVPVVPFARDFSFDRVHNAIVFGNLGEVSSLDLASLTLKTLYRTSNEHPMPFALPSGDVALSSDGDKGLAVLQAGNHRLLSPLGDGDDQATHTNGRWVAVRHSPKAPTNYDPPLVVAWDPLTNKTLRLDVPSSHFVESFGFVGGAL